MDWLALQAVASSVLVLTSAGAIGYASLQLKQERSYRSVSNLEKQLSFFLSEQFSKARKRLAEDRVAGDELLPLDVNDPPVSAFEVLDFYEHVGLLVKRGHLDVYDVWHTFYEWAQPVYVDLRELIESDASPFADQYSDLRKLMRQMDDIQLERMHEKNANHWALWTPARILDHYRYERETGGAERRRNRRARMAAARASGEGEARGNIRD